MPVNFSGHERKVLTKDHDSLRAYFVSMPSNIAVNSLRIEGHDGSVHVVRGILGIEDSNPEILLGAFCWGGGDALESFVFELSRIPRNTQLTLLENYRKIPASVASAQVRSFIYVMYLRVHDKFVDKALHPVSEGGGDGIPKLQAHKRSLSQGHGKQTHFQAAVANETMTPRFVELAHRLRIKYI